MAYIYIFRGLYANPHNFSMVCACPICFKSRRRALDSEPCKYALKRPGALLNGTCPSWMGTCPEIVRKWARTLIEPFDIYTHILLLLILLQYYYYYHYYYYHYYYYIYVCVHVSYLLEYPGKSTIWESKENMFHPDASQTLRTYGHRFQVVDLTGNPGLLQHFRSGPDRQSRKAHGPMASSMNYPLKMVSFHSELWKSIKRVWYDDIWWYD